LLDEADGIHDWATVRLIIFNPQLPIIITANTLSKIPYDIRKEGTVFNLQHPPEHQRRVLIDRICDGEQLNFTEQERVIIAQNATSWRSVINMLSTMKGGHVDAETLVRINEGGDEVVRILKGERIIKPTVTAGKVMRWGAHNMADPLAIQHALHFQEAKKTTGMVGQICTSLIMTLRVAGNIEAPPFYDRTKKAKPKSIEKSAPVTATIKKVKESPNNNTFGGFFT